MNVNDKVSMEYEERVMVDEEQYLQIKNHYLKSKQRKELSKNKNTYYDREDLFLINHEKMLRIREINDIPKEVTLKVKGEKGDIEITKIIEGKVDYSKSIYEQNLLNNEMIKILEENQIEATSLLLITSLTTERLEVFYKNYILVIDKNSYNGITDYDIEVEAKTREEAKKYLLKAVSKFGVTYKDNYVTKSRRAVLTLNK